MPCPPAMTVSTRGRYALRVMVELSLQPRDTYTPLRTIAQRQDISLKYLEAIMNTLSKAGFVDAMHGKGGGYRLSRAPQTYTVADILELTEVSLSPVSCVNGSEPCAHAAECRTRRLWAGLDQVISEYLRSITLADLAGPYE